MSVSGNNNSSNSNNNNSNRHSSTSSASNKNNITTTTKLNNTRLITISQPTFTTTLVLITRKPVPAPFDSRPCNSFSTLNSSTMAVWIWLFPEVLK